MKRFGYFTAALAALIVLSTPSCSKLREYIEQHPSTIGRYCRIDSLSITANDPGNPLLLHYKIAYDAADRPIKFGIGEDSPVSRVYSPDYHFRYDKKGRLSDGLVTDPGGTFVYIWHQYTYPSAKMIIDSIFEYQGSTTDPHPPHPPENPVRIRIIQLDAAGRPIHIHEYNTNPIITGGDTDIAYDPKGDQIIPGIQYDDKANIYQTSDTWQLFFMDFSKNNQLGLASTPQEESTPTPAAYNSHDLPTIFLGTSRMVFDLSFLRMDVHYACDTNTSAIVHH